MWIHCLEVLTQMVSRPHQQPSGRIPTWCVFTTSPRTPSPTQSSSKLACWYEILIIPVSVVESPCFSLIGYYIIIMTAQRFKSQLLTCLLMFVHRACIKKKCPHSQNMLCAWKEKKDSTKKQHNKTKNMMQTCKRLKRTLLYYDKIQHAFYYDKIQHAHSGGKPLFQATKTTLK